MGIKNKQIPKVQNLNNEFCDTCTRERDQTCSCSKTNKGNIQKELSETAKHWANMNKKS